jgi:hypothetical protein
LNGALLDKDHSTDGLAVYVDAKTKLLHVGVKGTDVSNVLSVGGSVFGSRQGNDPTALEGSAKSDMRRIREAFPGYGVRYWGHSHGAQLISMMQEDGEKSTTWAGYILKDTGHGVDTNIAGKNDAVIATLASAHELRGGKTNIVAEGAGHTLDSFVDGADLAAYNARVEYQKKQSRTTKEVVKAAGGDALEVAGAGEALVLSSEAAATAAAALLAAPELAAAGATALAGVGLVEAGEKLAEGGGALIEEVEELASRAKGKGGEE